jgi:hypothetical protein
MCLKMPKKVPKNGDRLNVDLLPVAPTKTFLDLSSGVPFGETVAYEQMKIKLRQLQCLYKDQKVLHLGRIRTRDHLFWWRTR